MVRIPVNPELLTWARERAGLDALTLARRFPKLGKWEAGELQPTLRQLEDFARAVHVAVGYLFLPTPPREQLPIPDFRTVADRDLSRPSANLLDTIYLCQQRQDWFRDYARLHALPPLNFLGVKIARMALAFVEACILRVQIRGPLRRQCRFSSSEVAPP